MKIKRFNLVNLSDGLAIAQIDYCKENSFSFKAYQPHSWDNDLNVIDKDFLCEGHVKWDACSHIYFNGQDYPANKSHYYHVCGIHHYFDIARTLQFILELASIENGENFEDNFEEYSTLDKYRKLGLLNGYEIREIDIEEWEIKEVIENW